MHESGILDHWKTKYSPQRDECFNFDDNVHGQSQITLEDLQGPFYLLAIGLLIGSLCLSSEYAWGRAKIIYKCIKRKYNKSLSILYWR